MSGVLATVTQAVQSAVASLPSPEQIGEAESMQLLAALDSLRAAIEPPMVSVQKLCLSGHSLAVVKVAMGMGIFDALAASGGAELTADELAAKVKGGDKRLLIRVMRVLVADNLAVETGKEKYKATPLSAAYSKGAPPADAVTHFYMHLKIFDNLYQYFEKNGYKDPGDAYDGPFQFAFNTKQHYFDWINEHPEDQQAFNSVMTMGRAFRGQEWFEYYPVEEKLQTSANKVVFIDIGGGVGHDTVEFRNKFPKLPGKMVVQDLPQVIDDIKAPLPAGVEAQKYDMYTEQPIKGAKAYYMRTVLHDWPNKQAAQALTRIREAMDKDSVLLINENTLPEEKANEYSSKLDLTMMTCFASLERTQPQWLELLDEAGFKVLKVWTPPVQLIGNNALFEAVPK